MALPQLNVHRYERGTRALITLTGEIDLATAPPAREAPAECLSDDIRSSLPSFPVVSFPVAGARSGRISAATGSAL
ncbi:hypothetical protein [Streptomyces sp. NBC_01334]|uniref:hypothetical protein n=1 Tax=Streptomyces sp. NBC_01334 TaxID=2903827 RepID=UPI002E13485A